MKTIEFEGKKYEVEDWVNWVARDESDSVFIYDEKPSLGISIWMPCGRVKQLLRDDWQDSLTKV